MKRSFQFLFSAVVIICFASIGHTETLDFPFQQTLDMKTVREVTAAGPSDLLSVIKRHGVRVLVVKSKTTDEEKNILLEGIEAATADLIKKAEFSDTAEGRMIVKANPCCDLDQDTLLVRDTASNYTIIHEFLHSQLHAKGEGYKDVETSFATNFRRMNFYQKRIFDDPFQLINPLWRRDMSQVQGDVLKEAFARIQMGQSQEAIIEKVLSQYIDEDSIYYNKARRDEGQQYGQAMINNAIDVYNSLNTSIWFCGDTVKNLREEILNGDIPDAESAQQLDEQAAKNYAATTADLSQKLEAVKAEILRLKEFYEK
ncbi:MAG TPA: hypothetical protein VN132_13575 [Bdellovibrio sp.]|nr:hypothetical protein [Bdellovibrio sp.]